MSIQGNWKKISPGTDNGIYPETISFKENGLYEAQAAADAERHPIWDAGTYSITGNRLGISTSTDSIISYDIRLHDDILGIRTADGALLQYQRS